MLGSVRPSSRLRRQNLGLLRQILGGARPNLGWLGRPKSGRPRPDHPDAPKVWACLSPYFNDSCRSTLGRVCPNFMWFRPTPGRLRPDSDQLPQHVHWVRHSWFDQGRGWLHYIWYTIGPNWSWLGLVRGRVRHTVVRPRSKYAQLWTSRPIGNGFEPICCRLGHTRGSLGQVLAGRSNVGCRRSVGFRN